MGETTSCCKSSSQLGEDVAAPTDTAIFINDEGFAAMQDENTSGPDGDETVCRALAASSGPRSSHVVMTSQNSFWNGMGSAKSMAPEPEVPAPTVWIRMRSMLSMNFDGLTVPTNAEAESPEASESGADRKTKLAPAPINSIESAEDIQDGTLATPNHRALADQSCFNGKWLLASIQGNFHEYLLVLGVSWPIRQLFRARNYGIHKDIEEIKVDGNTFEVTARSIFTTTNKMNVGAGKQQVVQPDGSMGTTEPSWDGNMLVCRITLGKLDVSNRKAGSRVVIRRWIDNDVYIKEVATTAMHENLRFTYHRTK